MMRWLRARLRRGREIAEHREAGETVSLAIMLLTEGRTSDALDVLRRMDAGQLQRADRIAANLTETAAEVQVILRSRMKDEERRKK